MVALAFWRGPPARLESTAVIGSLEKCQTTLSLASAALDRCASLLERIVATSLNDVLHRSGVAGRFEGVALGPLPAQMWHLLVALGE